MPFSPSEIAPEFLIWRARRSERLVRWVPGPAGDTIVSQFADHLSVINVQRHVEDYRNGIASFLQEHQTLAHWYGAILAPFARSLVLEDSAPRLRCGSLQDWRSVTSRIDADALLALHIARGIPPDVTAEDAVARLGRWGYYVGLVDHGLERITREGLADIHVHFEASDPLPLLWLRLATGVVPVRELPYFADSTLEAIAADGGDVRRRREDREILEEAPDLRVLLARNVGLPIPPGIASRAGEDGAAIDHREALAAERTLLVAAWRALLSRPADDGLARTLDRYLFAKSLFLRRHQQRAGLGPGLTRFRDFLDRGETLGERRSKRIKPSVRRQRFDRMLSLALDPEALRIIELRIAPQTSLKGWLDFFRVWTRLVEERGSEWRRRRLAVRFVVHFIRRAEARRGRGDVEFGMLRQQLDRQTAVLQLLRHNYPDLASHIVGIDVANLERACPPEVFAPYLQLLRGRFELAGPLEGPLLECWRRLEERGLHQPPAGQPKLGLTYHAGEDFYHPVDGLRAIDGLLDNVFETGDRLGHGLAVGWDVARFDRERGPAPMPVGVLLDNLVWMRRQTAAFGDWRGECQIEGDKLIEELGRELMPSDFPTRGALERSLDARYRLPRRPRPDAPEAPEDTVAARVAFDEGVSRRRSQFAEASRLRVLQMATPILPALQARIARKLLNAGVVVEANPSSNVSTGCVDRLASHPFFAYHKALDQQVIVTINTDDPGVFGTSLEVEFGLMFEAMREAGYDRGQALDLIDRSRRLAIDHAFGGSARVARRDGRR